MGVGNVLLTDEGVGVHVVQALKETLSEGELALIDGGTCPEAFYLLPTGIDKLIIVDAVKGGCKPGTVYRFTPQDIVFHRGTVTSVHQMGLADGLRMLEHTELKPKDVVIVGVEPKEMGWGLELSPEIQAQVPRIIDLVHEELGSSSTRANHPH
jgi:hydrogenase maturation protease